MGPKKRAKLLRIPAVERPRKRPRDLFDDPRGQREVSTADGTSSRLIVKNFPPTLDDAKLREHFLQNGCGEVFHPSLPLLLCPPHPLS